MSTRIYVAGPLFGSGRSTENVHNALRVAEAVRAAGATPFVPHLFTLWDSVFPHADENFWLDMDREWLMQCHGLIVIPGVSPGTRKEENWAATVRIATFKLPDYWARMGSVPLEIAIREWMLRVGL